MRRQRTVRVLACAVALRALALAADGVAEAAERVGDRYTHRAWGTADGLPQNSVISLVQTRDGYLWLATFGGLVRFDGHTFTVFDPGNTPGLVSARITTLHEDRKGVLWIGTEQGLARYDAGRFTTYTARDGLPPDAITAVYEDRQGRVWVGTVNGLSRFDGRRFAWVGRDTVATAATSFAETPDGTVWVGTLHGVARIDADGRATTVTPPGGGSSPVLCLFVDRAGRLWAAANGLWLWDPSTGSGHGRFVDVPLPARSKVHAISEDREGTLWIGTNGYGVYTLRDGTFGQYNASSGLTDNVVRTVLHDRDGNVWIGTDVGGLNRLKTRRVFSYQRPGSIEQSIGPIVSDGNDGLWIGATCGGLLHFRAGTFRVIGMKDGLPQECVWALFRDADGAVWVGAGGVTKVRDGRLTTFGKKEGLPSGDVLAFLRDRDGVLWVGTAIGLSRLDGNHFRNYGPADGLEHDVRCIVQDRDGSLWLGGTGGLSRFRDGRFMRYTTAQGLSHDFVRDIHEDADGTLWIGTYGGGLNRLKDGRFTAYSVKDGLPDNAVSRIIEDDRGRFWMSGNKGVFRVARDELNAFADGRIAYVTSVSYGVADGMLSDETNGGEPAGWRTADGRLWFPTIKGLVRIDPETDGATAPPVFVERVGVGGRRVDRDTLAALGPGSVDAEFHYTAVDLAAAEKTRFKYRLAGYDRDWIDSGARRVAYYTKIPPGSYEFEVLATSSAGVWSTTPAHVSLTVRPLWWQRRASQAGVLGLLLAATGFSVRFVTLRRSRARLAELERERALLRERARIARDLHDELGSRLTRIALLADGSAPTDPSRMGAAAREAIRTMDELVWSVNAKHDTIESFASYAGRFAESHLDAAGIPCRLDVPATLPAVVLPAETRRHLYLAFKEAVNNVVKHAQASEVHIRIAIDDVAFCVEIRDNGRGLPEGPRGTRADGSLGNGLENMAARLEAAGGTLGFESAPGRGTSVQLRLPLLVLLRDNTLIRPA